MNADQVFQQALTLSKNYTDESLQGAGELKGEKGDKGDKGDPGKDGLPGADGRDGIDGKDGAPGADGKDGKDGITYTPEIGTVTTVPSTENASASVDIDEENHTASFNFSIPKGEKGADGSAGTSTEFPDIYTTTDIPAITSTAMALTDKMLLGTENGNRTVTQNDFIQFLGKHGIGTGEMSNVSPGICAFLEVDNEEDIKQGSYITRYKKNIVGAIPEVGSLDVYPCIIRFIDNGNSRFFWNWFYIPSQTADGQYVVTFASNPIEFLMKKDETIGGLPDIYTAEDIPDAESIAVTDKMLLGTPDGNKKIDQNALIEFLKSQDLIDLDGKGRPLPELKSITKKFTISSNNADYGTICSLLDDFGIENIDDIVDYNIYCVTQDVGYGILYYMRPNGDIVWRYASNTSFQNITFSVSIIVKDYSSIGPAIVTDGIRAITKDITFMFNNSDECWVSFSEAFPETTFNDVIGIVSNYGTNVIQIDKGSDNIHYIVSIAENSWTGTFIASVTIFVKVPVVEKRPRFTKDVEITLNGMNVVGTGIILDGSDAVGGYTPDNLHFYKVSLITGNFFIFPGSIINNEIKIAGSDNNQKGLCKLRITIE